MKLYTVVVNNQSLCMKETNLGVTNIKADTYLSGTGYPL